MVNFDFIKTNDGSIGLFSNEINDVYHSTTGAKTESYDKFIFSSGLLDFVNKNGEVKILDICYGVGYNTKSALHHSKIINDKINIKIDAIEADIDAILLSPFINDEFADNELNLYLLNNVLTLANFNSKYLFELLNEVSQDSSCYLNQLGALYLKFYQKMGYETLSRDDKTLFLHNIYYQYESISTKMSQKPNKYQKCVIKWHVDDARVAINGTSSYYDFVFLDAFTPEKDPILWTIDFLALVKKSMKGSSVLVTYSKSAAVRAELVELGFCVGKILKDNKQIGTIASFDKSKIENELSELDLDFLKTNAGIFYRDEKLNSSRDEILNNRKFKIKNSGRISTTKFLKLYK